MTPGEKALTLAYIHADLLINNLDTALHELKINNDPKTAQLQDKLTKLKSASNNVFKKLKDGMIEEGTLESYSEDIEELMDQAWSK